MRPNVLKNIDTDCETRLVKSRIQLLISFPFLGTLSLSFKLIPTDSIPTAATDGMDFFYNPKFIMTLSQTDLNWVMAHEVLHAALGHLWRRGSRQHEKFNVAADYAIHDILMEFKQKEEKENRSAEINLTMPEDCLYDAKYHNKSAEEIYEMLPDIKQISMCGGGGQGQSQQGQGNGNQNGQGQGNGVNGKLLGSHDLWDQPETQQNASQKQKEWQGRLLTAAEAAEAAKNQGYLPGGISRLIGKLKKPQKDWKQLLAEFVQFEIFDYGWHPCDNRLFALGEYYTGFDVMLPAFSEETEKVQDLIIQIDTSGSISKKELTTFYSEIVGLMNQFGGNVKGHLIFCDASVDDSCVFDFEDVKDVTDAAKSISGFGGTRMESGIEYCIDKMNNGNFDISGFICLTDGYDSYSLKESEIPFKTLWVITNEEQPGPSYGTIARLKIE